MEDPGEAEAAGPTRERRLGSVPALDGLRGIAVLAVVASHLVVLADDIGGFFISDYVEGGFLGVDMFFALSGFLITALLLNEQSNHGGVRLRAFYGRRALRLLPALFALLLVHYLYVQIADQPLEPEVTTIKWAVVYASNWQAVYHLFTVSQGLGHLWSLAIEEQFYLIWPALLILLFSLRRNAAAVTAGLVGLIIVVAVHRYVMWSDGVNQLFLYIRTDTRVDSLLVGALLASLWVRRLTPRRGLVPAAWVATAVIAGCLAFGRPYTSFFSAGGYTLFALATAVLILATVDSNWTGNRFLAIPPLRFVGRISYGLYLWHLPIFFAVANEGADWSSATRVVVALGLTVLFTMLSWQLVERPALRWKRRLSRPVAPRPGHPSPAAP